MSDKKRDFGMEECPVCGGQYKFSNGHDCPATLRTHKCSVCGQPEPLTHLLTCNYAQGPVKADASDSRQVFTSKNLTKDDTQKPYSVPKGKYKISGSIDGKSFTRDATPEESDALDKTPDTQKPVVSSDQWDWDIILGVCEGFGLAMIGANERAAISALKLDYERVKSDYDTLKQERDEWKSSSLAQGNAYAELKAEADGLRRELGTWKDMWNDDIDSAREVLKVLGQERERAAGLLEALKRTVRFGTELCEDIKVSTHQHSLELAKEVISKYERGGMMSDGVTITGIWVRDLCGKNEVLIESGGKWYSIIPMSGNFGPKQECSYFPCSEIMNIRPEMLGKYMYPESKEDNK